MAVCLRLLLFTLSLLLVACSSAGDTISATPLPPLATVQPTEVPPAPEPPTALPTEPPPTTVPDTPMPPTPSFAAATYRDEAAGFELSYPATWTLDDVDPAVKQSGRGYYAQLTSWEHAPGEFPEVDPPGSSRLDIVVQRWDPKNDLAAFSNVRKEAWIASGNTLLSEEERTLPDGRPAIRFILQTTDGKSTYVLLSANDQLYLTVSGYGDVDLLDQIGQTLQWSDPG